MGPIRWKTPCISNLSPKTRRQTLLGPKGSLTKSKASSPGPVAGSPRLSAFPPQAMTVDAMNIVREQQGNPRVHQNLRPFCWRTAGIRGMRNGILQDRFIPSHPDSLPLLPYPSQRSSLGPCLQDLHGTGPRSQRKARDGVCLQRTIGWSLKRNLTFCLSWRTNMCDRCPLKPGENMNHTLKRMEATTCVSALLRLAFERNAIGGKRAKLHLLHTAHNIYLTRMRSVHIRSVLLALRGVRGGWGRGHGQVLEAGLDLRSTLTHKYIYRYTFIPPFPKTKLKRLPLM